MTKMLLRKPRSNTIDQNQEILNKRQARNKTTPRLAALLPQPRSDCVRRTPMRRADTKPAALRSHRDPVSYNGRRNSIRSNCYPGASLVLALCMKGEEKSFCWKKVSHDIWTSFLEGMRVGNKAETVWAVRASCTMNCRCVTWITALNAARWMSDTHRGRPLRAEIKEMMTLSHVKPRPDCNKLMKGTSGFMRPQSDCAEWQLASKHRIRLHTVQTNWFLTSCLCDVTFLG